MALWAIFLFRKEHESSATVIRENFLAFGTILIHALLTPCYDETLAPNPSKCLCAHIGVAVHQDFLNATSHACSMAVSVSQMPDPWTYTHWVSAEMSPDVGTIQRCVFCLQLQCMGVLQRTGGSKHCLVDWLPHRHPGNWTIDYYLTFLLFFSSPHFVSLG